MPARTLYHGMLCPFSRAVRVALTEKSLPFEALVENPWECRAEFLALNPSGEIPLLVESNGMVVSGAYAVLEFLDELQSQNKLLGNTPAERAEVRRIIDWFNTRFNQEVTRLVVFEKLYKKRVYGDDPDSNAIRIGKKNLFYHLDYISNLAMARGYLAGEFLTLADIVAAAHLSCLDYLGDVPWEYSDTAREWYALIKSRPSFRPLLTDRITAFRPPAHYVNPDF